MEELIQICRSLREEGKTLQSLKKLREAKLSYPNESKLLWELHLTYEVMSLHQKSEDELNKIMSLGKEVAKDHWEIAKLKLTEQPAMGTSKKQQNFVSRCMSDPAMLKEFPEQRQRAAVCYSQYKGKKKAK